MGTHAKFWVLVEIFPDALLLIYQLQLILIRLLQN